MNPSWYRWLAHLTLTQETGVRVPVTELFLSLPTASQSSASVVLLGLLGSIVQTKPDSEWHVYYGLHTSNLSQLAKLLLNLDWDTAGSHS